MKTVGGLFKTVGGLFKNFYGLVNQNRLWFIC